MASGYNVKERALAQFLSRFPAIKIFAKRSYQRLNYLLYKKKYTFKSAYTLERVNLPDQETFFGYYDKPPVSSDGRYVLFHAVPFSTKKLPQEKNPISVNVYDLQTQEVVFSHESHAYNWQQGTKMQWLDGQKFIFNNYVDGEYVSMVVDVMEGTVSKIPYAIYDCFNTEYALTLNFERLMVLRPDYGYRNKRALTDNELKELGSDGIFYFEFSSLEKRLLLSIEDILKVGYKVQMKEALHKVNHIMISPDGKKFMFLHRYFIGRQRFDRLMVADRNGKNLKLLCDDDMVSHCYWADNSTIVGYLRDKQFGDKYYTVEVCSGEKEILGKGVIDRFGDGHPSVNKDKLLFDTYPDKARMKYLFLFDLRSFDLKEIGEFYEGLSYHDETRCDLHPRFSPDGNRIFFDSVHEGKRQLYWVNLKKDK